jgi:ribosome biogenesis GTPase
MKGMMGTPHYNAYDSFKTKKSIDKKNKAKERSLGKKTNFDDRFVIKETEDFGVVIEVRYDDAYILYGNDIVLARLRKDINMVCNQVIFPGDRVVLNDLDDEYVIQNLISRTSLLSRVKKDSTRLDGNVGLTKNIAANINLAVIVVSAKEPPLHPKFVDRYLMILKNSGIDAIICLNKSDLKTDDEEKILDIYRKIDIPVVETSTYQKESIENLKKYLKGKQAIFVGNSGVGKSSLTNAIMDDDEIKTSHVSEKSKRGRHTTTTSKYYVWDDESSIIDTPGIRSLDVSSFKPIEIQDYFSEFNGWKEKCKYSDCLHFTEPYDSCLVKQGVASGILNKARYESYIRIISSLIDDKKYDDFMEEFKSYGENNQKFDEKKKNR